MKRDWELMGKIFTAIEDERLNALLGGYEWEEDEVTGEKRQPDEFVRIIKHLEMLIDCGYIKGVELRHGRDGAYSFGLDDPRITLPGYDFADIVQDHALLTQTMNAVKAAGYIVSWETLKQFAPVVVKRAAMKLARKVIDE